MFNQVAVVYTNLDGTAPLKCKKTNYETVENLLLDADERYLVVAIIKDFNGQPFLDKVSGHDCVTFHYNPKGKALGGGAFVGRLHATQCDITPNQAKAHTWTKDGTPITKLNKPLPAQLASAATHSVQFYLYDGPNYNDLDTQAQNFDVLDDTLCELV